MAWILGFFAGLALYFGGFGFLIYGLFSQVFAPLLGWPLITFWQGVWIFVGLNLLALLIKGLQGPIYVNTGDN